jgi:very-short-patch-repair endonuclease
MFHDNDRELAASAERTFGVFTLDEARAFGFTNDQIDHRVRHAWHRIFEGVYRARGAPATWQGTFYAATRAATAPVGISHASGFAVFDLPRGRTDLVEVACRRWKRSRQSGLVVHETTRISEADITTVGGIAVVKPEVLLLQMAGRKPFPNEVERMIQAMRRKRLITFDSTIEAFEQHARRGLRGVRAMRAALERWDPNSKPTQSDMETWLIQCLREHGLPEPVTQFRVLDQFGNFVADTDAAIPKWKITIEYQSMQEHLDEFQAERDDRRRNEITAAGYIPLHARYNDLRTGGAKLADQIVRAAREHGYLRPPAV